MKKYFMLLGILLFLCGCGDSTVSIGDTVLDLSKIKELKVADKIEFDVVEHKENETFCYGYIVGTTAKDREDFIELAQKWQHLTQKKKVEIRFTINAEIDGVSKEFKSKAYSSFMESFDDALAITNKMRKK